jgi:hypothetical protein
MRIAGFVLTLALAAASAAMTVTPGIQDLGLAPYLWALTGILLIATIISWPVEHFWKRGRERMAKKGTRGRKARSIRAEGDVVQSFNQMGGQTAHTIQNIGPQPRVMHRAAADPMLERLRRHAGMRVELAHVSTGGPEAYQFSTQMGGWLQEGGWIITQLTDLHTLREPQPVGVEIHHPGDEPPGALVELQDILRQLGFRATIEGRSPNPPAIWVGMQERDS